MEEGVETHQIAVGEAEVPIKVTSQANTPAEEIRSCRVQGESILDALPFSITRQKLGDFSKICEKSKLIVIMLLKTPIKEFPTGCYAPSL